MLRRLKEQGFALAILSNGSPLMLRAAVDSAGIAPMLDAVLSVEEVGVFKPDPAVYAMVGARFGTAPAQTGFVSSNGWDACAAAAFGFRSIWVNREGNPERHPEPEGRVMNFAFFPRRLVGARRRLAQRQPARAVAAISAVITGVLGRIEAALLVPPAPAVIVV